MNQKKRLGKQCRDSVVQFDAFAEPFNFLIPPEEGKAFRSCKGLSITVVLVIALIFYGSMQSIKLFTFDETDIMVSQRDAYFDSDYIYSKDLMYSFGMTDYDKNPEPIEDPSYGVIKPYYKSWNIKEDGIVDFEELPTRKCSEHEFHINGKTDPKSKFFKPSKSHERDIARLHRKLKCLDVAYLEVQGDYNTYKARQFVLLFEKCDNATFQGVCKSEEQIKTWLARKFIFITLNNVRFSTKEFSSDKKVVYETNAIWIPVNSQIREE